MKSVATPVHPNLHGAVSPVLDANDRDRPRLDASAFVWPVTAELAQPGFPTFRSDRITLPSDRKLGKTSLEGLLLMTSAASSSRYSTKLPRRHHSRLSRTNVKLKVDSGPVAGATATSSKREK